MSLISLGTADLVASARELTPQDVVRRSHAYRTCVCAARAERPTAQATDFVVRAEFYRDLVFPEASRRAGAPRCAALAKLFCQPSPRCAALTTGRCRTGVTVDKEVLLLDLGGASMSLLKVMHLFKELNRIGSSYFPERTLNILVLNAPRVFSTVWSMARAAHARHCAGRLRG